MPHRPAALLLALAVLGCRASDPAADAPVAESPVRAARADVPVPAPLALEGKAYDAAAVVQLPPEEGEELPGLHHVFRLSDDIVSGAEPEGPAGLQSIADLGVKTILSVDGKAPDAAAAAALGLRYVHVPIQYKGITQEEVAEIAKTFRELEGPFYVHCFHGKHRGPSAAAIGRVVLDGAPREQAIAEMRQYCGTSPNYEGLYRTIAVDWIPSADQTAALDFDFPAVDTPDGVVGAMVPIGRAHDNLTLSIENDFRPPAHHPDLVPLNEANHLEQAFEQAVRLDEVVNGPADMRGWMNESLELSRALVEQLQAFAAGDAAMANSAKETFAALEQECKTCHTPYRN